VSLKGIAVRSSFEVGGLESYLPDFICAGFWLACSTCAIVATSAAMLCERGTELASGYLEEVQLGVGTRDELAGKVTITRQRRGRL
jgi:hypothetical protein